MAWRDDEADEAIAGGDELPRLALVHVPKTAGSAVTNLLAREYGPLTLPAMTTLDYQCYGDGDFAGFRFYKGHAYRSDYKRLPPDTVRMTVLRDPVARAVSFWKYYRAMDADATEDPYVADAIRHAQTGSAFDLIHSDSPFVVEHLRLGQMRQFLPTDLLHAIGHRPFLTRAMKRQALDACLAELERFDHVLTSEMLALSLPPVLRALGLDRRVGRVPRDNVSLPAPDPDVLDIRRAVMDVNDVEFACYDHVRQREIAALADG